MIDLNKCYNQGLDAFGKSPERVKEIEARYMVCRKLAKEKLERTRKEASNPDKPGETTLDKPSDEGKSK